VSARKEDILPPAPPGRRCRGAGGATPNARSDSGRPCRWFAGVKRRRRDVWLSYF